MRKLFPIVAICTGLLLSVATLATAQDDDHSDQKFTDLDKAVAAAKEGNKQILMIFAGSDWCRPCIQFEREVIETGEFSKYAGDNLVVLYLDFPIHKKNKLPKAQVKHNEALAAVFNPMGEFPKVALVDTDMNLLGYLPFHNQTADHFVSECEDLIQK